MSRGKFSVLNLSSKPSAKASCTFIERLDPDRAFWVLGAPGHIGFRWQTFPAGHAAAERWIAARHNEGREVWLLLGDVAAPINGREIPTAAVAQTRYVAAVSRTAAAFLARTDYATIYKDASGRFVCVWRLDVPIKAELACYRAALFASQCCHGGLSAAVQEHFIPLPPDLRPIGMGGSIVRMPMHRAFTPLAVLPPVAGSDAPLLLSGQAAGPLASATTENAFLARQLEKSLSKFGVSGRVVSIRSGPVVTVCDFEKEHATKVTAVIATADDVAMLMKAKSIIARSNSERGAICFDVANKRRETVFLRDMFASSEWREAREKFALPISIGVTVDGTPRFADLARMPHLLVAGSTGSGKSVALNAMLLSLLTRHGPEALRLMLVDPKRVELTSYAGIPHLLAPVATDAAKAVAALEWLVAEMERRYETLETAGVKTIARYNAKGGPGLPFIVVVVDEYASLMHLAPKPVNAAIGRLTAEARAAGIYLVLATQHPSARTLTPPIRANVPVRLIFKCAQKETSQAAIGSSDATKLLGMGDGFLWLDGDLERIHGAFADDEEVEEFVDTRRKLGSPVYALTFDKVKPLEPTGDEDDDEDEDDGSIPVRTWLHDRLKGQPSTLSTTVITEGVAVGYNHRAVRRAAKSIGVIETLSGQVGVAGSWELPCDA